MEKEMDEELYRARVIRDRDHLVAAGFRDVASFKANRKKRMARRRRPWAVGIPSPVAAAAASLSPPRQLEDHEENHLRFLLQKELRNSDVGSLGRMVLPKIFGLRALMEDNDEIGFQKGAEAHLPILTSREGILMSMDDMDTLQVWNFKYRFWPNNKSRMYVLENTGEFVKSHGLRPGDFIMLYRDDQKQKYIIRARKNITREAPSTSSKNGAFNVKTAEDHLVANMEASKSRYFHVNLPVTDEMCMGFLLNDAYSSEFPIDLSNGRLYSSTSIGSVENLSLDDFP